MQVEIFSLPVGADAYSASVRSVFARGFHGTPVGCVQDWRVMANYLRLVEEVGEYQEAVMWEPLGTATHREIADVMIVLCQLAWLAGINPHELGTSDLGLKRKALQFGIGHLARCLRKDTGDKESHADTVKAIKSLANQVHLRAARSKLVDIEALMLEKCTADEGRGHLHAAAQAQQVVSNLHKWATFADLTASAKKEVESDHVSQKTQE